MLEGNKYKNVGCPDCSGYGCNLEEPDVKECKTCAGSGALYEYENKTLALYKGGPMRGRM